jgi:hypothetical protein
MAILINRTFVMSDLPASAMMGKANKLIPFADLFDINVFRRAYGPGCCILPSELNESARIHTRFESDNHKLLREFQNNKSRLAIHKHIQVCGTPIDFIAKANITSVYKNTRPHPSLMKTIHSTFDLLRSAPTGTTNSHSYTKPPIICVHLRTEYDFLQFFRISPGAYTGEQILAKMNLTKNKHPTTSFAKLWTQNKNQQMKPVLYLAGGDTKAGKQMFIETGWFSAVDDKDLFLRASRDNITSFAQLLIKYNAPSSLLTSLKFNISTVLAIIDMEICKKADIFIGNNYSSYSERLAWERQMSDRWEGNATRTLENGGRYNYMVNALSKDAKSLQDFSTLEPLHPFCAKNSELFLSYQCKHV